MKCNSKVFRRVTCRLALLMVMSLGFSMVAWTQGHGRPVRSAAKTRTAAAQQAPLVEQTLDYTENPVDVPNPDRGFERSNDDASGNTAGQSGGLYAYMRVPASANTLLCQPFVPAFEMSIGPNYQVQPQPFYLGGVNDAPGMPGYLNVPVYPRIIQFYLVLNEFSSNAQTDSLVGNCSKHANVGTDGPITQYGLDYIASWLQFIRDNTNSVVHIRVNYDPKGWNQIVWDEDNLIYADGDTGHTNPFTTPAQIAANIAQPLADTWRGATPIYRQCTVPGFENMNWVQYHYYQLAPIFQEYHDIIWAFDSGTFGPWGESHSNYDAEDPNNYKMVLDSLLAAVPDGKIIMTHLGGFLAWYNRTYNTQYTFGTLDQMPPIVRGTPEARFGMFEDSASDFSEDEWSYNDDGSASEGYRMLAHDPMLPGYDPAGVDPSQRKGKCSNSSTTTCTTNNFSTVCGSGNSCVIALGSQSSGGGEPIIGYNDSGTNRLEPLSEPILQPDGDGYTTSTWRAVWFTDWDRTKAYNFYGLMADHGGEQIGNEPKSATNGCYVPPGNYNDSTCSSVIQEFPVFFYEGSITRRTYLDMQQGSGSFASRNIPYTQAYIAQTFTLPQSGQQITPIYDPVYEGQSALDYYRDRMGFRFVLRDAWASASAANGDGTLQFNGQIQNVGWGQLFNKKAVTVILKSPTTGFTSNFVLTDIDPYAWQPAAVGPVSFPATTGASYGAMPDSRATNTAAWNAFSFALPMSAFGVLPVGDYNIYLKITDPAEQYVNKRSIQFANNGANVWDNTIAANLIGSTTVILSPDDVVTFTTPAPGSAEYGSSFTVAASGTPGTGAITYTSDGVVCTNSGATYTMIQGSGTCTVTATQAADSTYASASASEYVTATNANASVSVISSVNPSTYGQSVTFTATISSDTGQIAVRKPQNVSGAVTWSANTGCGTTVVTAGYPATATCTTSALPVGSGQTITANYAGDSNHAGGSGAVSQEVDQANVNVSVASSLNPSTYGQSVTFTATISGMNGLVKDRKNEKKPMDVSGTVTWSANTGCGTTIVTSGNPGTTNCITSILMAGASDTITANYNGDDGSHNAGSGSVSQEVDAAGTTVSVGSSQNPSTYSQSVTFTATIGGSVPDARSRKGASGRRPLDVTGTMTWSDNTGCGTTPVTAGSPGTATCITSSLNGGTDTVATTYSGDSNNSGASGSVSQQVNRSNQTIGVSVPAPATATNKSSFTVVATASSGLPITFSSSGACFNKGATYTIDSATGTCTVTMNQAGNGNYTAAPTVTERTTVAAAQTPTVSVTAPASAPYQSTFTVIATTNASTTPTITAAPATVCTISGTTVTMVNGIGTCTVTAKWAADDVYKAATAKATTTAEKAASVVTWATPDAITYGTALSATQLDATASVAGKFVYTPASGKVLAAGTHTLSVTFTPAEGTHYTGVTGTTVALMVNPANTTTSITSTTPNPSGVGQLVTVSFTAAPGKPTGSVTVSASSGETCSGTLTTGRGSCKLGLGTAGSITLTATYGGDANNNGSVSAGFTQMVN